MTDAEPALSPKAQVQVKFRPGIQVTALTSFPFGDRLAIQTVIANGA